MKVSNEQVLKVVQAGGGSVTDRVTVDTALVKLMDAELIESVVAEVNAMPDREEMVAELRSRIRAGTYQPTGEEIADAMIRRAIVDSAV